jgi:hypothetical protein
MNAIHPSRKKILPVKPQGFQFIEVSMIKKMAQTRKRSQPYS